MNVKEDERPVPPINGRHILSVSQWGRTHEIIRHAVTAIGGMVTDTSDPNAAVKMVEEQQIHLAVLDMDVIDDREAAVAFEKISAKIPVAIVVTRERRESVKHKLVPNRVVIITDPLKIRKVQEELAHVLHELGPTQPGSFTLSRTKPNKPTASPDMPLIAENGAKINIMLVEGTKCRVVYPSQ